MTAHYIARVCESKLNQIDCEDMSTVGKYNLACGLLDDYIRLNFDTFEETELVYKFAKVWCDKRVMLKNHYRSYGWMGNSTFKSWLISRGYYNFTKTRFVA